MTEPVLTITPSPPIQVIVSPSGDQVTVVASAQSGLPSQGLPLPLAQGGTGVSTDSDADLLAALSIFPAPAGTAGAGQIPVATGAGNASAWTTVSGSGTVTAVSVASANGFAGTVANPSTTPAITMQTSVTGLLKGNGTAISAASAGTDYLAPAGNGSSLTGITASQVGADASGAAAAAQAAAEAASLPLAGGTMAGVIAMGSHKVTGLTNGSVSSDAAAFGQIPTSAGTIGGLLAASNLSDLANAGTARGNLGLGSAATQNTSAFLQPGNNLSDVSSAATARTNLGLGTAATQNSSAFDAAGSAQAPGTLTSYLAPKVVSLSFGASIAVNAALGNVFAVTLTASTGTIANPTNPVDGQVIRFRVIQDGTGSRTVAWDTAYDWGTGAAPTLSTGASKVDILGFEYVASISKWCSLGAAFPQGY